MKRTKKVFNRTVAYNAYCYYMQHEIANFNDTADFLSKLFCCKYSKDDVGKMFRHLVIFGAIDETAKKLTHTINMRSRYDKGCYNRFLGYRYEYPELLKELEEYESIIYEKNHLKFLISEYKNFSYSEMESEGYLNSLNAKYEEICISFNLINFEYLFKLKEKIKKLETYKIKELLS